MARSGAPRLAEARSEGMQAPAHLSADSSAWWRETIAAYELEPHHLRLLTLAAEAYDRCSEAREAIAGDGPIYTDRFGAPRTHPAVAIERDSRLAFARLVRDLNLDADVSALDPRGGS